MRSSLSELIDTGRLKDNFTNVKLIGQGGFGKVYRVLQRQLKQSNSNSFAIKVVKMHIKAQNTVDEVLEHRVYREVKAMKELEEAGSVHSVRFCDSWFEELTAEE